MDKQQAALDMLAQILPLVPFEGWNQQVLHKAAVAAGYKKTDAIRVFPGGAMDAVNAFMQSLDKQMLDGLQGYHLDTMKIRERIALAVRLRLEAGEPNREALRRAVALQAMPFHCGQGLRNLYRTVDAIWYAIGDTSSDFNFYTNRLLLAGVYSSTLLFWLDDDSIGHEATAAFMARRIEDVMKIEKAKYQIKNWFERKTA
jgi:ubiquinone biosynthesis protein COQ9